MRLGILGLLLIGLVGSARADNIELRATAEREIEVAQPDGTLETRRVPAGKVVPGETVHYTIGARNVGQAPVESAVITNPIPQHMDYVGDSATTPLAEVTFSVDDGASYAAPAELTVPGDDGKPRRARPDEYTHIRWQLRDALEPGEGLEVQFAARLE